MGQRAGGGCGPGGGRFVLDNLEDLARVVGPLLERILGEQGVQTGSFEQGGGGSEQPNAAYRLVALAAGWPTDLAMPRGAII